MNKIKYLFIICLSLWWTPYGAAQQTAAIASAHPLASAAGHEILKRGGNAFDAAVAVAAALAVVEPYSSGMGGGGFFLLHRVADAKSVMLDARETAPAAVKLEHYLDAEGNPRRGATLQGGTAAGIPGTPAGLAHLARHYGALPLGVTLAPAIRLAREGFALDARYVRIAKIRERHLRGQPEAARIFLADGRALTPGYVLKQTELAQTLAAMAEHGAAGFYQGSVARALVEGVNAGGGAWQLSDLQNYRVIEREPMRITYNGARITTASLPSAGGIALTQAFAMLEQLKPAGVSDAASAHTIAEVLRRVFRDRIQLGDPDNGPIPVASLTEKKYINQSLKSISQNTATASEKLGPPLPEKAESRNTTHFSVIDSAGNRVGATLTINWIFGSGLVAKGTGVLLNNEIDDFTLRADLPNSYRLLGSQANAIAPGKRPLSSMTPTFVEDERGVLILGAPGGSRIISMVLLGVLEHLRMPQVDLQRVVALPRYHHQFWPDRIEIEPEGFSHEWRAALQARGHAIQEVNRRWGNMQAVFKSHKTGEAKAANDPRGMEVAWY
ncbi:MAG: gamma-glutamyltransferase [Betaproteobacteria bacterium]|nr:gamma-glutamyltransferase [Betaproteobacteria bacterium]